MFGSASTECGDVGRIRPEHISTSITLTVEKIALLKDAAYVPSCSINPVLSCGSVMTTPQAELSSGA